MTNLDSILKGRDITLPTKVHLVKAMVFPVIMYGCEGFHNRSRRSSKGGCLRRGGKPRRTYHSLPPCDTERRSLHVLRGSRVIRTGLTFIYLFIHWSLKLTEEDLTYLRSSGNVSMCKVVLIYYMNDWGELT